MTDHDARWAAFEAAGEELVRKNHASGIYGDQKKQEADAWLAHKASLRSSEDSRNILAEARNANDLARSANVAALEANAIAREASSSAKRSADAARTNNIIATAALIAAVIAIAISTYGIIRAT